MLSGEWVGWLEGLRRVKSSLGDFNAHSLPSPSFSTPFRIAVKPNQEAGGREKRGNGAEECSLEQRMVGCHHFPSTSGSVEILISLEASTGQQNSNLPICKTNLDMATH